ncbi:hypothetical protein BDF22DRAFT_666911 [Syncephalis plumigaleata]|nr:hypothetical protein BDF22DRAFT_666911 [Syncephalis plumigaleata]
MEEFLSIFFSNELPFVSRVPPPPPLPPPPPPTSRSIITRIIDKLPLSREQLRWYSCLLLSVAGLSVTVFGYIRYGTRTRRIRKATNVYSLESIRKALNTTPQPSSVWCKMTGRVHCPNPVIAPLCGFHCAYAQVVYARRHMHRRKLPAQATKADRQRMERKERRRWSKYQLNELFNEQLQSPWSIQIRDGEHIVVDMTGADLHLEQMVNRKNIHESILRNDASVFILGRVDVDASGEVFHVSRLIDRSIQSKMTSSSSGNHDWLLITTQSESELLRSLDVRWLSWSMTGVGLLGSAAFIALHNRK